MSYRDCINIEKTFKRIKLKEEYLGIILPEVNYLQFVQDLEIFHARFQGVYGDVPSSKLDEVDVKAIRDQLRKLNEYQNLIIKKLRKSYIGIKHSAEKILLIEYFSKLEDCKKHLIEAWNSFNKEINFYKGIIYDIKILLKIDESLVDIKSKIYILISNVANLRKSTYESNIKIVLTKTYSSAIFYLIAKFEQIEQLFPKLVTLTNSDLKSNSKMELVEEKKSENSRSCDIPCENEIPLDYNECPEKEICLCDAPQVPEPFNVEQVCEISSSSSSQSTQADNDELIKGYQIDVEKRKDDLYKLLTELLKKSRDISRIENEIYTKRSENELRIECINSRIVEINNNESLSEDEKEKKLKCYECKKFRLNEKLEEDIRTLEDQKIEIKKYAKCQLKQLKYMSKVFVREHNRIVDQMERLKLKAACPEKIDEKMQLLENEFENEQKNLDNFKSKITNLYDEDGSVSSFSSSSESDSSSTITRSSLSKEVKLLKVRDVKNDNEMYIKHVLGKALIHGLAAITVYQPSDPIYYLANYLLHYRYNELSNIRKQLNFEELLIEREKYVERTEEALKVTCDPCGMNKEGACE